MLLTCSLEKAAWSIKLIHTHRVIKTDYIYKLLICTLIISASLLKMLVKAEVAALAEDSSKHIGCHFILNVLF